MLTDVFNLLNFDHSKSLETDLLIDYIQQLKAGQVIGLP